MLVSLPHSFIATQGSRVLDFTFTVAKKRAAFAAVKRSLHSCPEVKFGLRFPARLRITLPNGSSHHFLDPILATEFVNKNCK